MTSDYTNIDKLREQGQTSVYMDPDAAFDEVNEAARIEDALATAQRWEGRANALDKALSAAVAELVGLRTEVDQLRTENAELRENVVHMESERTGKCLACGEDWTCDGYYADIAHEARIENLITAERDALQARIDALTSKNARATLAWLMWCYKQGYINADDRALTHNWMEDDASLLHRDDVIERDQLLLMADEVLAALGVDPQKETDHA